jgi:RimJ/RimL family protein N-acetyltransferase
VTFCEGDRVYFRPVEFEDERKLRLWINDPRNWAMLARFLPVNGKREREWIESMYADDRDVVFGVVVKQGDRLIGTTGLHRVHPVNRSAEFGIRIGDVEYQDNGFGSEATALTVKFGFDVLNLNRISLGVFGDNIRATRAYEKAGFVREGVHRQAFFRNGRWHDGVRYAILREEWQERKSKGSDAASLVAGR